MPVNSPRGPFHTKNATALESVVSCYHRSLLQSVHRFLLLFLGKQAFLSSLRSVFSFPYRNLVPIPNSLSVLFLVRKGPLGLLIIQRAPNLQPNLHSPVWAGSNGSRPQRGCKFGCVCSYMAGHYPGILMTGHIGTSTPKFALPRDRHLTLLKRGCASSGGFGARWVK